MPQVWVFSLKIADIKCRKKYKQGNNYAPFSNSLYLSVIVVFKEK